MERVGASRGEVIAQRLAAQSLAGERGTIDTIDTIELLWCGFQDAGAGTGLASLALRCGWEQVQAARGAGDLVIVMSLRGVPHIHRRRDLEDVRAALTTGDRYGLEAVCGSLPDEVMARVDPVGEVAGAMVDVFSALPSGAGASKGELSTGITPTLPTVLTPFCERCTVRHVIDGLFRLASLRARLELVPEARTQTFRRVGTIPITAPAPEVVSAARAALVGIARSVAAPADVDQLAAWLGLHRSAVKAVLFTAPEPPPASTSRSGGAHGARLLPARDAWLRGSDRAWLLGANSGRRSEVFKSLGAPGVMLADGEIVGTWRQRKKRLTLEVDVSPWRSVTTEERDGLEADAAAVAQTRGLTAKVSVG